ncbi:ATP-binding protein [Streptomyces sp. NPDC048297]|uniref:ATP-binding protein n=1 Tax=Streptomyces sp. NPDC048297 TaxID=3365531 RepID=UPI00371891E6
MNAVAERDAVRADAEVASASVELPAVLTAPREARAFTRRSLRHWGAAEDLVDAAVLVVCELVTNAVCHGSRAPVDGHRHVTHPDEREPEPSVTLRLRLIPDALHAEVHDQSPELPVPHSAGHDDDYGRGLAIVGALSGSWTSGRAPGGGKWVRACLPREAAATVTPVRRSALLEHR